MSKKITSLIMATVLSCGLFIACGADSDTSYKYETLYGEVKSVSDSGFTMTVGTYSDGELTLGSDTVDIMVSEDTTYSMSFSGGGDKPGEPPSGGAQPENKPDGETPSGEAPEPPSGDAQPENKSDGEAPSGEAPEQPSGESPSGMGGGMELSLSRLREGTQVAVTFDTDGNVESVEIIGGMSGGMGQPGGNMSAADITYSAVHEFSSDETLDGKTIESTGTDESAILVTDGEVTVSNSTITRNSDDSTGGDNSSFYGVGAALLTTGGTLTVENCTIDTDAAGGAGDALDEVVC